MSFAEVLRLAEAADFLRVSERTLREMAKRGQVPCQRVGREWRFLRGTLESWLSTPAAPQEGSSTLRDSYQMNLPIPTKPETNDRAGFGDTAFTKNREQPIHSWVPWIAGFSAQFVAEVIEREKHGTEALTVLDPFAGVGTTLVEGQARGCHVIGFEINPYAALACRVKLMASQLDPDRIRFMADEIRSFVRDRMATYDSEPMSKEPEGFRTRDPFFSEVVRRQVLYTQDSISSEADEKLRQLAQLALGAILVGVSNYTYEPSLGRRVSAGKEPIEYANVGAAIRDKLYHMASDIEEIRDTRGFGARKTCRVCNESFLTRAGAWLKGRRIDVLVTSPPYLNNYHYVRNTRPQMYWLGFASSPGDLRQLETDSFGQFWQTVRGKDRIDLCLSYPELEGKLDELRNVRAEKGQYGGPGWSNYAATYFNDCARFSEIVSRILKPGGVAVVVLGNNILQGVEFKTESYFTHIAERYGLRLQEMHVGRTKRTGNSLLNSAVRAGVTKKKVELYEVAVELRAPGA